MTVQLNVKLANWLSMLNACCTNGDAAVVADLPKLMMPTRNLSNANVMSVDLHLDGVLVNVDERPLHGCFVQRACAAALLRFVLGSISDLKEVKLGWSNGNVKRSTLMHKRTHTNGPLNFSNVKN